MITLSLDTLVSLGSLLAVGLAIYAAMRGFRTEIRAEIAKTSTELKNDIAESRTELKNDIAESRTELKNDIAESRTEVKADISRLDERTFLLAAGLRPRLARPAD